MMEVVVVMEGGRRYGEESKHIRDERQSRTTFSNRLATMCQPDMFLVGTADR